MIFLHAYKGGIRICFGIAASFIQYFFLLCIFFKLLTNSFLRRFFLLYLHLFYQSPKIAVGQFCVMFVLIAKVQPTAFLFFPYLFLLLYPYKYVTVGIGFYLSAICILITQYVNPIFFNILCIGPQIHSLLSLSKKLLSKNAKYGLFPCILK